MKTSSRLSAKRVAIVMIGITALALEIYIVFVNRQGDFRIEGKEQFDLEFGSGAVVSHAFLMRGDGLNSVAVRFGSNANTHVKVRWTLWRGMAERPDEMTRAFEGADVVELRPGHQWRTLLFTRDASSRDRWYTIELRALGVEGPPTSGGPQAEAPRVAVVASRDNPERGGLLSVDGVQRPGSLLIRAGRQGRTLYRRFVAEVEPNLPAPLRVRAVQWTAVVAFHWAFLTFAWTVLRDAGKALSDRPYDDSERA